MSSRVVCLFYVFLQSGRVLRVLVQGHKRNESLLNLDGYLKEEETNNRQADTVSKEAPWAAFDWNDTERVCGGTVRRSLGLFVDDYFFSHKTLVYSFSVVISKLNISTNTEHTHSGVTLHLLPSMQPLQTNGLSAAHQL